jgi:uncharacterized membrane protein YdjX (TVP38/TMEM64 family)
MRQRLWGWITVALTILTVIALLLIIPAHQKEITTFTIHHPFLAPFMIILFRAVAIIIPPIPGGILSFALIPVLGWFWSYVYAVIGMTIGASVAFFIARKFREPIVAKFVPLQDLHLWEKQLSHKTEFVGFLLIRLTTGPIMDFISYVAGLTKISFKKFLLATLIAELPSALVYYFSGEVYKRVSQQNSGYIGIAFILIFGVLYYFFKDHKLFQKRKRGK